MAGDRRAERVDAVVAVIDSSEPRCGTTRLVAIDGPSGAGKTTLARDVAAAAGRPDHPHGRPVPRLGRPPGGRGPRPGLGRGAPARGGPGALPPLGLGRRRRTPSGCSCRLRRSSSSRAAARARDRSAMRCRPSCGSTPRNGCGTRGRQPATRHTRRSGRGGLPRSGSCMPRTARPLARTWSSTRPQTGSLPDWSHPGNPRLDYGGWVRERSPQVARLGGWRPGDPARCVPFWPARSPRSAGRHAWACSARIPTRWRSAGCVLRSAEARGCAA